MSHFSFARGLYDKCNLQKKEQESIDPFNWVTDKAIPESNDVCFQGASPFMHSPFKSIPVNAIDYESELRGQSRNLSRCPSHKYNPNTDKFNVPQMFNDCNSNLLVPEYTRINKPCNVFAGVNINRFNILCENPQDLNKIQNNSYIGDNTRLIIKNAFDSKSS